MLPFLTTFVVTSHALNVGFYNTGQSSNILDSINDISGNNPPTGQTEQIEEIIRESDTAELDVLCLSDLLLPKQLNDYKTALNEIFPHSFSQLDIKPDSDFNTPRTHCTTDDFVKFQSVTANCSQTAFKKCDEILRKEGTNVLDFQICLAQECPLNYEQILYDECISCLSIYIEANNWDPNQPGQAIGLAVWGCGMPQERVMNYTDGTIMLSKYEIKQSLSVPIPSFIFYEQRLNIIQIEMNGTDIFVGCVNLNPTTYKDNIESYVAVTEEQRNRNVNNHIELNEFQIEKLMEYLNDFTDNNEDISFVLLGDLGMGHTWYEDNFNLLTYEGLENFGGDGCTFCVKQNNGDFYNELAGISNSLYDSDSDKDLDHILLRNDGNRYEVKAFRRFMENKNSDGMPYSPRWGVAMEIQSNDNK